MHFHITRKGGRITKISSMRAAFIGRVVSVGDLWLIVSGELRCLAGLGDGNDGLSWRKEQEGGMSSICRHPASRGACPQDDCPTSAISESLRAHVTFSRRGGPAADRLASPSASRWRAASATRCRFVWVGLNLRRIVSSCSRTGRASCGPLGPILGEQARTQLRASNTSSGSDPGAAWAC